MLLLALILSLASLTLGRGNDSISFVNPAPAGANADYTLNPSYALGSSIEIQYTSSSDVISLVLYQQTINAAFEYIFQNEANNGSVPWTVATAKDLTVSRIFFFQIFIEGESGPTASSHYFNITSDSGSALSTSTTSISSATGVPATAAAAPSMTPTTSSPVIASPATTSGGLSTTAKLGLGVGIPLGVAAGLALGFIFFRHRRNAQDSVPMKTAYDFSTHTTEDSPCMKALGELYAEPPRPVEMPNHNSPKWS